MNWHKKDQDLKKLFIDPKIPDVDLTKNVMRRLHAKKQTKEVFWMKYKVSILVVTGMLFMVLTGYTAVSGMEQEFEKTFRIASEIISSMNGYISHELQRCMEVEGKFLLLVRWERLEDHTMGFRQSSEYQEWKELLHHFYHPFPTVEHFEKVKLS